MVVDLVAKITDGEYWAVQCKFYADTKIIAKPAVDSFFSEATRTFGDGQSFAKFIWIQIIDLETLHRVQINWALLDNGFNNDDAREHYQVNDRGQLIMACGNSKIFTALKQSCTPSWRLRTIAGQT